MKTVIQIPHGCTFHGIEDAYPNRVKQYWRDGDRLTVISTDVSEVSHILFQLKLRWEKGVVEYQMSSIFNPNDVNDNPYLTYKMH